MTQSTTSVSAFAGLRKVFWPIEGRENRKFIPMAIMMACILFNYSTVRSIKDGLVISDIGPEAISFLKMYFVLPSAVIMMVIYANLCNIMTQQKVFYTITSFFIAYFLLFAFVIYPNPNFFHPSAENINALVLEYPNLKWFIKIAGKWSYATFYVMAEMWGSMMLSLLFWQFANQITKTSEAKRFYSMFGLLGNLGLLATYFSLEYLVKQNVFGVDKSLEYMPVLSVTSLSGFIILFLYRWVNANVLTDPELYDPSAIGSKKKKKAKLGLADSFKMIFSSKYLGLLVVLVIAYGVSINLVEGVWKSKINEMFPNDSKGVSAYMGEFQFYQGIAAILFMLVGANILRRVSWSSSAMLTPIMIVITGIAFFYFIIFDESDLSIHVAAFLGTGPLAMVVSIGMVQNVLSKATKYSLFDATKEMAYIPLDDEMKSKGKAAVDVIGGRFGKSGGGFIQSTFFVLFPSYTFVEATPYFAVIFFVIVVSWLVAVRCLSKEYIKKISENETSDAA